MTKCLGRAFGESEGGCRPALIEPLWCELAFPALKGLEFPCSDGRDENKTGCVCRHLTEIAASLMWLLKTSKSELHLQRKWKNLIDAMYFLAKAPPDEDTIANRIRKVFREMDSIRKCFLMRKFSERNCEHYLPFDDPHAPDRIDSALASALSEIESFFKPKGIVFRNYDSLRMSKKQDWNKDFPDLYGTQKQFSEAFEQKIEVVTSETESPRSLHVPWVYWKNTERMRLIIDSYCSGLNDLIELGADASHVDVFRTIESVLKDNAQNLGFPHSSPVVDGPKRGAATS